MNHLQATFSVSERRAARVVSVSRSTLRYQIRVPDDELRLLARMEALVRKHPRYGYRRIGDLLRREGFRANPKRIYRLWRREGYRVPRIQHKRRRLGSSENACHRHRPEHTNHIWALDFIFDRDENGRCLKWLSIVDEYTRECPTLLCNRSITATDVIDELIRLMKTRGTPEHIRLRQRPRVHRHGPPCLARPGQSRHPLRGTGRPLGERLR